MIKMGSLFSGIGGFELGLERAIPGLETIWQVEQDKFCQRVLKKHWPNSEIYNDVKTVGKHNLKSVDIICGGFPCQDISLSGKQGGIYAEKSGLWWQYHRIISELQPRVAILENVPNLLTLGLPEVLGSLSKIGYDAEWCIVSAEQFGAPHLRRRIFIVAYSISSGKRLDSLYPLQMGPDPYSNSKRCNRRSSGRSFKMEEESMSISRISKKEGLDSRNYWERIEAPSPFCRVDDGIPHRTHRIKALGNAIVPACSEWIGKKILNSGLLNDLLRA